MTTDPPSTATVPPASRFREAFQLRWLDGLSPRERTLLGVLGLFLLADVIVVSLYVVDSLTGRPIGRSVDLALEHNLPAYYSSAQLFVVGAVLALYVSTRFNARALRSWLLLGLPVVFIALAADEALSWHERAGGIVDGFVTDTERENLIFDRTGFWMILIGLPFVGLMTSAAYITRSYFPRAVLVIALVGFAIMMGGALGLELVSNFVEGGTRMARVQILAEEGAELLGVTVLLGAALSLHSPGTAERFLSWLVGPRGRRLER